MESPLQHFISKADAESTSAVRELLRLKDKLTALAPLLRGELSDAQPLSTGDACCEMMVQGRGVVPPVEAWRLLPVVDEAVNSIMELERRR